MKRILFLVALAGLSFAACQSNSVKQDPKAPDAMMPYGETFEKEGAVPVETLVANIKDTSEVEVLVEGTVAQVCKAEGCWLKLSNNSGEPVFVAMKDHKFMVPKDCEGKKIVLKGTAKKEITSVEEQQHYAADAGKSAEEIAAITTPKEELKIEAVGVKIQH